jgi:hypothetical protein
MYLLPVAYKPADSSASEKGARMRGRAIRLLLLAAIGTVLALSAGAAAAGFQAQANITCDPGPPDRCFGTPRHDVITGSIKGDDIYARAGADFVDARNGHDHVFGGRGDDLPGKGGGLEGGPGNDEVFGQRGGDTVRDEAGGDDDHLFGGPGNDFVNGVDGDNLDLVSCGRGRDFFDADPGDTVLDNCERPL